MTSQVQLIKSLSLRLRTDLHLLRKLWHVVTGIVGLVIYSNSQVSQTEVAKGLLLFSALIFTIEFLRFKIPALNYVLLLILKPLIRESEKNSLSGIPFYSLGVGASLFFFEEQIAILSILFLIFSDPISSLMGILFGKDKILPNKSLQGSLAGAICCYFLTLGYGLTYANADFDLLIYSLIAGAIGSVSEMASVFIDDNLTIPVLSGLGLTLLNLFIPVF